LSNIDEIKQKADFISMYEIIKSLEKYKSTFDLTKTAEEQIALDSEEPTSEILTDQQIIDHCTKKPDTLELNNVEIEDQVENLTIEEYKHVTKEESQKAFEQLLNRFQNSLKFEEKHIDLLNNVKAALDFINTNDKIQKKLDKFLKI
jgi:hypothetical protein